MDGLIEVGWMEISGWGEVWSSNYAANKKKLSGTWILRLFTLWAKLRKEERRGKGKEYKKDI